MLTTKIINQMIGVDEAYKAPDQLMKTLFLKEERDAMFRRFLDRERCLDYDWFHDYFQDEHADRKQKKQDFTPDAVGKILTGLLGSVDHKTILDIAAGTGSLTIRHWVYDRNDIGALKYKPSNTFYSCEELSDRTIPFLLFNLMIRGMNAVVLHGDSIERHVKQIYFVQNDHDDQFCFSSLNVMPHSLAAKNAFSVKVWLEEAIQHVESELKTT